MKISNKTLEAISKTERQARRDGNKAEHLFSTNKRGFITYTGHTWAYDCAYSESDLVRRNYFAICSGGAYGAVPDGLTEDDVNLLYNVILHSHSKWV